MNPPKRLRLGPHTYRVVLDEDRIGEGEHIGRSNSDRLTITLDPTLPHTVMADTLIHELVHCAFAYTKLDRDVEEDLALLLAPVLLGALRDNPALVEWLTA